MKSFLVVDDSRVIRNVARRILEALNFKVNEAADGQQALDACKLAMPDAILLDWNMPVMDGIQFLRALRGLPEPHAQRVIGNILRDTYRRFALYAGVEAVACWCLAFASWLIVPARSFA